MSNVDVNGIGETRANLSQLVRLLAKDPHHHPIVIGSHRTPQAMLVPFVQGSNATSRSTVDELREQVALVHRLTTAHKLSAISVIGPTARGESRHDSDADLLFTPLTRGDTV